VRRRAIAVLVIMGLATPSGLLVLAAPATATTPTRYCGSVGKGIGVYDVRASRGVTCRLAKQMMAKLLLGSRQCYPHGYTSHPRCRLYGFLCSSRRSGVPAASHGRCVKGRRLATGTAGP
jgi:hypothetical protein